LFLDGVVVGPVVEEILFRGLFYGVLLKRFAPGGAMVISSLLFAAAHEDLAYFLPLFYFGLVVAWFRWKSGSLGLSILIHCLSNGAALLSLKMFGN